MGVWREKGFLEKGAKEEEREREKEGKGENFLRFFLYSPPGNALRKGKS